MRLHRSLLEKFVALKNLDNRQLRALLDDIGLEVKDLNIEANEAIFEIETLAHRGDHLSVLGVAREVAAKLKQALCEASEKNKIKVDCELSEDKISKDCINYHLLALNVNSIPVTKDFSSYIENQDLPALVQILNYIQLEIGQPMHAFDANLIQGSIKVVTSSSEHKILALDGKEYVVPADSILIMDDQKIVAVAGVIGCENSKVTDASQAVLIEAACFDPVKVRKTARKMGISTDASYAFERGVDPDLAIKSLIRLLSLLPDFKLGQLIAKQSTVGALDFELNVEELNKQTGWNYKSEELLPILSLLGYSPIINNSKILVKVPGWRFWNVKSKAVVYEDLIRLIGYNSVMLDLPQISLAKDSDDSIFIESQKLTPFLLGQGFIEVVTRSFYAKEDLKLLSDLDSNSTEQHLPLKNSVDKGYSHLKITNILHLARLAEYNHRQGVQSVKAFEFSRIFSNNFKNIFPGEQRILSLVQSGRWFAGEWRKSESIEDRLYLFKGVIESLLQFDKCNIETCKYDSPYLHPGRQLALTQNEKIIAFFGEIHPAIAAKLSLSEQLVYAEINLENLKLKSGIKSKQSFFPSVKRDITLRVSLNLQAGDVLKIINSLNLSEFAEVIIIDSFKKAEEDFSRVSYRLRFQSQSRTLQAEEVDQAVKLTLEELAKANFVLA